MKKEMTRREFVSTAAVATLTGATLATGRAGHAQEAQASSPACPNILVIHADQHRMECLGAYGNSDIRTPHIDSLAADGVRFDNSFCPFPVCTPSRYSLLSGLYVHQHRGWSNYSTLPPGTATFPGILRAAGYRTKAVGKMHFTPTYLDLGFDQLVLAEQNGPGRWDDDYHRELRERGLVDRNDLEDQLREYRNEAPPEYWDTFGALPSNLPAEMHSTTWIGDRAAETLAQWGPSGNLLMVGFIKPHHPFDPPREYADAYDPEKLALLPGWTDQCFPHDLEFSKGYFPHENLSAPSLRRAMAYYYATIQQIDDQVGRMLDLLKRKGLYEGTMIVYTADHGEYMGFHHMLLKGNHMYDPVVKVPLIVKYPAGRQRGAVSNAQVSNVDLAPTIVKQAGCRPAETMTGLDLAGEHLDRPVVFAESGRGTYVMARSQGRKLLLWAGKKRGLFYDLEKDPLEMVNRYDDASYRDEIQALVKAVADWRPDLDRPRPYLDEDAPVIDQPNVPSRHDGHRDANMDYYREKMQGEG